MASRDSIPESQRDFQTRGMEIFAGFVEHADAQVGRLLDGLEARGLKGNTLAFCVFGDNGSSAEGRNETIGELLAQNNIPDTVEQQLEALDRLGGIEALGSSRTDSMYHAGWAWAGGTPFKGTKLMGSRSGGARNPMVISWPNRIYLDGWFAGPPGRCFPGMRPPRSSASPIGIRPMINGSFTIRARIFLRSTISPPNSPSVRQP